MESANIREQEGVKTAAAEGQGEETMESLLAGQDKLAKQISGESVAWVKVVQVTKEEVLVDVGEKLEGAVPITDFKPHPVKGRKPLPCEPLPKVGQRIPVVRAGRGAGGMTSLSYKRARASLAWESVSKAFAEKSRVRGRVVSAIKGGFLVEISGIEGFLPASLADLRPVRNTERLLGTGVRCTIIELNQGKKQLVLSRKAVLEEEAGKRRKALLAELRIGEVRIGRVVRSKPAGLVLDIGGVEGFVRASDIAWGDMRTPPRHERGTKLRAKVIGKPAQEGDRVPLGIKQLTPNPGDAIRKKFPMRAIVRGKILSVNLPPEAFKDLPKREEKDHLGRRIRKPFGERSEAVAARKPAPAAPAPAAVAPLVSGETPAAPPAPYGVRLQIDGRHQAFAGPAECDEDNQYKVGAQISAIVIGVDPKKFDLMVSISRFADIQDRKKAAQYLKAPPPLTLGQLLSPESE